MSKFMKENNEKTTEELAKAVEAMRTEIAKLEVESAVAQPKNTNIIANKRKQLAVLLTALRQKKA